jgi:DNA-binding transcriptional ArsR family regulator
MQTIQPKQTGKEGQKPKAARRRAVTPRAHLTLRDPEQLHAIGDPTRWRILGRLVTGPASIQELARALGAAKGRIGHHVGVLERAGLIRLAETKQVRGVVEKRYIRVARQFRLPDATSEVADEAAADLHMLPVRSALAEARRGGAKGDPTMAVVVRARMPAARARRFGALIDQLAAEFADGAPGSGETFGFVGAIYVPDWSEAAAEDDSPATDEES